MPRAVIYARYSTDKQRESSIEDQARVCRGSAAALRAEVVALHADDGVSGSTPVGGRIGGRALLVDALAGRFDILIIEGLDRLSRDLVEQETIVRRLEHRGLRIVGVSDGYDTASGASRKLTRGMRGLVNEIYLDDLRAKTHRGLVGQIERGFHAGGISFGYRSVGNEYGHRLEINEQAATWVRWIFARYGEGWSCQRIAHELNLQRVTSPRGSSWAVSALYGSPAKGSGILNNEVYIGRYVWNRSQWVKDPDTGRRQRIDRPQAEWRVVARPELRIVSEELWQAVRERMSKPRALGGKKGRGAAMRTLFGGALVCGKCGGAVVAVDALCYGCAAHKDRGPSICSGISARRVDVDRRLLSVLRDDLLSPAAVAEIQIHVQERIRARRQNAALDAATVRSRLGQLEHEIGRLVDAIAATGISPALKARLGAAEDEIAELKNRPPAARTTPDIAEGIAPRYKRLVNDLEGALKHDTARARGILRDIFGPIRLVQEDQAVFAEFAARTERLLVAGGDSLLGRVAGTGFEPVTFGL